MRPYYQEAGITIFNADCREVLPTLRGVHLCVTDPPYFKVVDEAWDHQWASQAKYLDWVDEVLRLIHVSLAENGTLYWFALPRLASTVELVIRRHFSVIASCIWDKGSSRKGAAGSGVEVSALRTYWASDHEQILVAEQYHTDSKALGESGYAAQCEDLHGHVFEPIRAYLDGERRRAGIDKAACNEACGFAPIAGAMASRHYFSPSQWCLPTQQHYRALRHLFNTHGQHPAPPFADYHPADSPWARFHLDTSPEYLRADYEALRADYEALRADYEALRADYEALRADYEALRRPFRANPAHQWGSLWRFSVPRDRCHPTEKPLAMMSQIVDISSRPGNLILDPCMGSGVTLEAGKLLGREMIGIDTSEQHCEIAVNRLRQGVLAFAERGL